MGVQVEWSSASGCGGYSGSALCCKPTDQLHGPCAVNVYSGSRPVRAAASWGKHRKEHLSACLHSSLCFVTSHLLILFCLKQVRRPTQSQGIRGTLCLGRVWELYGKGCGHRVGWTIGVNCSIYHSGCLSVPIWGERFTCKRSYFQL